MCIRDRVPTAAKSLDNTSDNFRWSATVAGFGMLLRDSEFKQDATYKELIALGKNAKGNDIEGYRAEMIKMMRNVSSMQPDLSDIEAHKKN